MKWAEKDAGDVAQRLRGYLGQLGRWFPGIWDQVEMFRAGRGKELPNWAGWCYLPLSGAVAIATKGLDPSKLNDAVMSGLGTLIAEIGALAAWRPTQGIYRFHPEVFNALWDTPVTDKIPVEILYRLPEWGVYIDTYGKQVGPWKLSGFFAHLEYDVKNGRHELRLLLDGGDQNLIYPVILHISGSKTITDMLDGFMDESIRVARERNDPAFADFKAEFVDAPEGRQTLLEPLRKFAARLLPLVLYLCSMTAEFKDARGTDRLPARAKPTKTKRGARMFPPDRPTIWDTGYRIGGLIEQARQDRQSAGSGDGAHASPEPHIRKSHWHSFWRGPKDDAKKREIVVHWLPPIPVGYKPGQEIVPTIRPVA